jgi:tetratricopeptide (TPR) repeat protein
MLQRWAEMVDAADAAVADDPNNDEARYWLVRARLHTDAPAAAEAALADVPDATRTSWARLRAIVRLHAHGETADVDAVAGLLETPDVADAGEQELALAALRRAVRTFPDQPPEHLLRSVAVCRRVDAAAGPQGWCEYVFALHQFSVERDYRMALRHGARATVSFDDACPVWLIRAACAVILGSPSELAEALAARQACGSFEDDADYLAALCASMHVSEVSADASRLIAVDLARPRGRLVHVAPALGAAGDTLRELHSWLAGQEPAFAPPSPAGLDACAWARWLWARLELVRHGHSDDVPSDSTETDPDHPVHRFVQCYETAQAKYGEGRSLLRAGAPVDALRAFGRARHVCSGQEAARVLARAVFEPVLTYWEGVALAHHRQFDAAADKLECVRRTGLLPAVHTQLGLIGIARGHPGDAAYHLQKIGQSRSSAALYLEALVARSAGNTERVHELLTTVCDSDDAGDSVYRGAALRLRGVLDEERGDLTAADRHYRRALAERPGDVVAAARLARVWARDAHARRRDGGAAPPAPDLDSNWEAIARIPGLASLQPLHAWLAVLPRDRRLPSSAPGTAMQRLAAAVLLQSGHYDTARHLVSEWAAQGPDEPALAAIQAVLTISDTRGDWQIASDPDDLERLRERTPGQAPLTFWIAIARMRARTPSAEAIAGAARFMDTDLPAPHRAFAAITGLFAADDTHRSRARAICRSLLDAGTFAPDSARDLAALLVSYLGDDDEEFLACYAGMESRPTLLPCGAADVYVCAAEARLRTGRADAVLDGRIPEDLATLSDPAVRRVLALAYAQRAARRAEHDAAAALGDLDQALGILATEAQA